MNDWLPIDSAPKTRAVLVFDPTEGMMVAAVIDGAWTACADGSARPMQLYDGQETPFMIRPTFWLPLPPKPGDDQ